MKNPLLPSLLFLAAVSLLASPLHAQGPVTTGTVVSVAKEGGTIIVNSTQTGKPITLYGLEKASVMNSTGTALTIADVKPGALVSVHYQPRGDRWFVSRIVVPETPAATVPAATPTLTTSEAAALRSKAANDGDITTEPGTKARIDGDRTTQPGKKDPADPDITKRGDNK